MDTNTIWQQSLKQLELQMPRATYDMWLSRTTASPIDSGLQVVATDELAVDWLTNRLRPTIERAVESVAGQLMHIEFVVAGDVSVSPSAPAASPNGVKPFDLPNDTISGDVASIAHYNLFKNQWAKHPRYLRFYPPYWATINSYAGAMMLTVWQSVRDQFDLTGYGDAWTPALTYSAGQWATLTGVNHQRLFGVWRGCPAFDIAYIEGEQMGACCRAYPHLETDLDESAGWPQRTKATPEWPEGRLTCRHWIPGAFEMLAAEKLAGVRIQGKTSDSEVRVQIYLRLPLLTPAQAARLPGDVQREHESALTREHGVDLNTWRSIEAARMADVWQDQSGYRPIGGKSAFCAVAQSYFFLRC